MGVRLGGSSTNRPGGENHRMKHRYRSVLKQREGLSESTIRHEMAAIGKYEIFTMSKPFKSFDQHAAVSFKDWLNSAVSETTGKMLSASTKVSVLRKVKRFFKWLSGEPGYKSKIRLNDIDYLNPPREMVKMSNRASLRRWPELSHCERAFDNMPKQTFIERRARAFFALVLLTAGRTEAIAGLKIHAIDFYEKQVVFDATETRTKNSKSFRSCFNPVSSKYEEEISGWIDYLLDFHGFTRSDLLLPKACSQWAK